MRCSVVFGVTLRHPVTNISSSSPTINTAAYYQRCVTTCSGTVAVVHRRPCWQHLACCILTSRQWSEILAQNRSFCLPHLHSTPPLGGPHRDIAMPFGMEKLEWCGHPMVKIFRWYVYSFDRIHERDRHTDTHTHMHTDTAWRHRLRLQ